ncbi:unnamed protein product, partial [Musa acuminata subsp. burmannicoides]
LPPPPAAASFCSCFASSSSSSTPARRLRFPTRIGTRRLPRGTAAPRATAATVSSRPSLPLRLPLATIRLRSDGRARELAFLAVGGFVAVGRGACGYGTLVDVKPLRARVGAVSPVLFKGGEGCGACYKVRCVDPAICSRRAVTVIVTDECPGGYCASGHTHFDLSGAAFGRMAVAGEAGQLRDRGEISVIFRRTPCKYPGKNIAFHVNEGSTNFWLSLLVEFEGDDGDIGSMHIKQVQFPTLYLLYMEMMQFVPQSCIFLLQVNSMKWLEMKHVWGASWCIIGGPLQGPFSVKLTTLTTQRTLSARDVIPRNWSPKATYTSRLNFL